MSRRIGALIGHGISPIVESLDVNAIVNEIDLNEVLQKVDVNQLVSRPIIMMICCCYYCCCCCWRCYQRWCIEQLLIFHFTAAHYPLLHQQ